MIRLIIKGTAEEARAALDARKLQTCMALMPQTPSDSEAWVDAVVHDTDSVEVVRWFNETFIPPFAPGTLLFFSPYDGAKE
jgi:hypothetical protein